MNMIVIDNLRDWQTALDKLLELKNLCILDDYQPTLARMLRYGENWRLTERVLEYATDIRQPELELLEAIMSIMTNGNIYMSTRILAAEALRVLAPRSLENAPSFTAPWKSSAITKMEDILGCPQAPLFREAVSMALEALDPSLPG